MAELEDTSNIIESSVDLDDFLLKEEDEWKTLGSIFQKFLANDLMIAGNFKSAPGVWFCKWFNTTKGHGAGRGYNKGDFFWLNTENTENFIRDNNKIIRDLANVNPFVIRKLPAWKNNDQEIFDMYYAILSGFNNGTMSKPLEPLYEIGQISNDFQIIVSQKDNNTDPISEISSWKRFAVNSKEDYDSMFFTVSKMTLSALENHVDEYHFGRIQPTQKEFNSLSNYADSDFSNVRYTFSQNYVANNFYSKGFDCVDAYVRRPYSRGNDNGEHIEQTWFRKWKSGFLEHGGIVDIRNYLNHSKDLVVIPFNWKLLDDGSKFYQVNYIGKPDNPIEINDLNSSISDEDNLISVLQELDSLIIDKSDHSPIYYSDDYVISLVPIQQVSEEDAILDMGSYTNMGNYSVNENTLNSMIDLKNCTRDHFAFKYNSNNTPNYYSYYVRGFC